METAIAWEDRDLPIEHAVVVEDGRRRAAGPRGVGRHGELAEQPLLERLQPRVLLRLRAQHLGALLLDRTYLAGLDALA